MQDRYSEIQQAGARVLVVTMTQPKLLTLYLNDKKPPFDFVSDTDLKSYQAFGLGHSSWGGILKPSVLGGYLRRMLKGFMPRPPNQGEDVMQLGGDFVLDAGQKLVYTFRSKDPTDRPPISELLSAIVRAKQ